MASMLGRGFTDIIRHSFRELVGSLGNVPATKILGAADAGRDAGPDGIRAETELHGRWYAISALPVHSEEHRNAGVVVLLADVTERALLLERERAARGEADAANQAKSEFLATMSHEIRTPINAIMGYTDLLDVGIGGGMTDVQRDYLTRLRASGQHLLGLVNDVLDLAKVDAGEMTVAKERHNMRAVMDAAVALLRPQAEARGIRSFGVITDCLDVPFVGDDHRVRQILVNLLSNAVKFTAPGGAVTVECGASREAPDNARLSGAGPWAFVRISDTGIGISPEQQSSVFEPFVQAESGKTRTKGGTGLGLTISRRLARLMGGDLTLASTLGDGSVFTLWLPAPTDAESATERNARARKETPTFRVHGLAEVGRNLRDHVCDVLESFTNRLRADPDFPNAASISVSMLQDHTLALLGDIAQQLVIVQDTGGQQSDLFRDGSRIQQLVSELHGRQRSLLGWSEKQIAREMEILAEEIEGHVRRRVPEGTGDVTTAIAVLRNLIRVASETSVRAARQAAPERLE
jgi:signal transduction histidine kinase